MKELYETPEAKIIGFAPFKAIAASWDWSQDVVGGNTDSDIDTYWSENPEGSFRK